MTGKIRFHLDECVAAAVAEGLRRRGVDVTTTPERHLREAIDLRQLTFAAGEGRVLVTQDADFLRLHSQGVDHAGIAFYRPGSLSTGQILRILNLIYSVLTPAEMNGNVEYL